MEQVELPWSPAEVPPRAYGYGPPQLVIIGEAPGLNEEIEGRPFCGPAGNELFRQLYQTWGGPYGHFFTANEIEEWVTKSLPPFILANVFPHRPADNDPLNFFGARAESPWPARPYKLGKYIHPRAVGMVEALHALLRKVRPKLIIALGGTALWALRSTTEITKMRGNLLDSDHGKILPTFHPAYVLRQYQSRPTVLGDLKKAKGYLEGRVESPSQPTSRKLNPSLGDIEFFARRADLLGTVEPLSVDIENTMDTTPSRIWCIGFSIAGKAICVPFFHPITFQSYWKSAVEEASARMWCQWLLLLPMAKAFQNGLWDVQFLLRERWAIQPPLEDTFLLHHALFPELPRGLHDLVPTYLNVPEWKSAGRMKAKDRHDKEEG